jgi:retinol-binding protein 3
VSSCAQPAVNAAAQPKPRLAPQSARLGDPHSNSLLLLGSSRFSQPRAEQAKPMDPGTVIRTEGGDVNVNAGERQRIINGAVANLTKYYIDPGVAQKMADALWAHEKGGDDDAATDGEVFADLITTQMRHVSHDRYVMMVYTAGTTPESQPAPTPEEVARYREEMEKNNCTFEKVKILPHNIGYLKFNEFPDASICRTTAAAAMASMNRADAIIFDLRDNPGGYANMVALIATYLFDRPTHLNDFYNRSENTTEQSWTLPPVPGNRLADKPAFVLTSSSTFSAAEGFSYDLKMLKRATLVGETTSGRGHMGMGHPIDDHFTLRVPGIRVINPISKTNWEGTGVEPDVKVRAADALTTAEKLAERALQKK